LLMAESHGWFEKLILVIAVAFGTINVIGGFLVTDRMLEMFKGRSSTPVAAPAPAPAAPDQEKAEA
jgi:NAD(P) transhydrogenase subunit alpha